MTTQQLPRQISASIHQDAINRVADFFNATIHTISNELLQNSRRAGASRVDITLKDGRITFTDDGAGISDPQTLLAFGLSQWNAETADRENPAGMGVYSLARRTNLIIRSKAVDSDAWKVSLTPEHFVGAATAPIEPIDNHHESHGTSIEFDGNPTDHSLIAQTARYYPLPVYINGQPTAQEDFLHRAAHVEAWNGVRIGVYVSPRPFPYGQSGTLNFHGTIVQRPSLPFVQAVQTNWAVKVDVVNCPQLQLTLPARQEIVQGPFADSLRAASRAAIYRAMLLQTQQIDVPRSVQQEAASLGVTLPDASPLLKPWQPETADSHRPSSSEHRMPIASESILMSMNMSPPDQQALYRAAQLNDADQQLFEPNAQLEGYPWYDAMTRLNQVSIIVDDDEGEHDLHAMRHASQPYFQRPSRIEFLIDHSAAKDSPSIRFASDLAFAQDQDVYMDEVHPIVTRDSALTPDELTALMTNSFFDPREDDEADSHQTQQMNHQAAYYKTAISVLQSHDHAVRNAVLTETTRHILPHVPSGSTAAIFIDHDGSVQVDINDQQ